MQKSCTQKLNRWVFISKDVGGVNLCQFSLDVSIYKKNKKNNEINTVGK